MKKFFVILLATVICALSFVGCDGKKVPQNTESGSETLSSSETEAVGESESTSAGESTSETETETETESETAHKRPELTASCIEKKGNRYVIVLPASKETIPVRNSYDKYLVRVSDELVKAAEEKISEAATALGEEPSWSLTVEGDNLYITVEIIKFVEGADYMEEGGCGIDHEHITFSEIITVNE